MRKFYGIQYLRAAAALGVVCFHAAERTGGHFAIGAAGVDVFFVVSGFLMWVISENKPASPGRFFRDRLERVAPVYWIATCIMVAGALAGLFPNLKLTLQHVFGSLLFIPHRSPSTDDIWPVLVQGWTLNYEMFFYAVFAGTLVLPSKARLAVLGVILVSLAGAGMLVDSSNPLFLTYTNPIILEFLLGALIGKLWLDRAIPSPAAGIALIIAALAGFAFVGITYLGFNAFVFGPLSAALLVGVLALEKGGVVGRIGPAAYIGDSSYSIYLWHTMAISVVAKFAMLLSIPAPIAFLLAVVGGVVVGAAFYEILERPIAASLKGLRARPDRTNLQSERASC